MYTTGDDATEGTPLAVTITPQKLAQSLNSAWRQARAFRDAGRHAIKQFVGPHYGASGVNGESRAVVNYLAQYLNAMIPNLAPGKSKNKVESWNIALRFEALQLGLALDRADEEEDLVATMRQIVTDALVYPFGCAMTGLTVGAELVKIDGQQHDPGKLFTRALAFEDVLTDPAARRRSEALWDAHRYRVPKSVLKESGIFNPERVDALRPLQATNIDSSANIGSSDRDRYGLVETVELWDVAIYDGSNTTIVTLGAEPATADGQDVVSGGGEILYQERFNGPEQGPYSFLEFIHVPNRVMALPPVALLIDLHEAKSIISRKIVDMMTNTKRVLGYQRVNGKDDAETIVGASNFEAIAMDDPNAAKMFDYGGVPKEHYEGSEWLDTSMEMQSAVQRISGAASNSGTATESTQLQANSMLRVQDMQERVKSFRGKVAKQRLWYLANDPLIRKGLPYRSPGGEMIQVEYSAETRQGESTDFNVAVEMVNPQASDPNIKFRRLIEFLQVLPTQVPLAQAGLLDLAAEIRLAARELDMEELDELIPSAGSAMQTQIVHQNDPQMQPGQPVGVNPTNPQAGNVAVDQGQAASNPTDQMNSAYQPAMQGGM